MLQLNPVKERLLFLSPVVQAGWEREANINDFEKLNDLGSGAFGVVKKMKHKKSQTIYAIKHMSKAMLKNHEMIDQIKIEIKIMYSLCHENIIKLYNHFEDNDTIYLVIQYAQGGQLWEKMHRSEGKRIPEKQVAIYIKELVSALEYLHGKGIIHRDIKPENLLLDSAGHLKLADFGWSNYLNPSSTRNTLCGTPDYLAPEMLSISHTHDYMVDIWSCGVLIYELLTGKAPFTPTDPSYKNKDVERGTQENIINVKFDYPKDFPQLAKDLVSKILKKNPRTRLGIHEIKNHPWIKLNNQGMKPQIDPSKLIADATFGQNMAQVKSIVKPDEVTIKNTAFTEDEIILYARPDSLLDNSTQLKIDLVSKNNNIDLQVSNFKNKLALMNPNNISISTSTTNIANTINTSTINTTINTSTITNTNNTTINPNTIITGNTTPNINNNNNNNNLNPTILSNDFNFDYALKTGAGIIPNKPIVNPYAAYIIHTESTSQNGSNASSISSLDQIQGTPKDADNPKIKDEIKIKELEIENSNLKKEIQDLRQKLNESESKQHKSEIDYKFSEEKYKKLFDKYQNEKQALRDEIKVLEQSAKKYEKINKETNDAYFEAANNSAYKQVDHLLFINQNLKNQIKEQEKILSSHYTSHAFMDDEKKKLIDDNKVLMTIIKLKQEYLDKIETEMISLVSKK